MVLTQKVSVFEKYGQWISLILIFIYIGLTIYSVYKANEDFNDDSQRQIAIIVICIIGLIIPLIDLVIYLNFRKETEKNLLLRNKLQCHISLIPIYIGIIYYSIIGLIEIKDKYST